MRRLTWIATLLVVLCLTPAAASAGTSDGDAQLTARVVERRGVGLVMIGSVVPDRRFVYVQRATRCDSETRACRFTFYRRVAVDDGGGWQTKLSVPPSRTGWLYRAKAGTSYSSTWLVCTRSRATDRCRRPN